MSSSLAGSVSLGLVATLSNVGDLVTASAPLTYNLRNSFTNGLTAGKFDLIFQDTRSLNGTEDIDCSGSLTDPFGNAVVFAKIGGLIIVNKSNTVGEYLKVGGDANSVPLFGAANDLIKIGPGGFLCWYDPSLAGIAVTAATGDIIQVEAAAGTISYDIVILGRSA